MELEAGLDAAKDDLSVATMNLRAMIRAFKETRLLPQPGQFAGKLTHTLSLYTSLLLFASIIFSEFSGNQTKSLNYTCGNNLYRNENLLIVIVMEIKSLK